MRITNIQHFSLDDGPGIRTTVFFAGCNMRCLWCHNPENFENIMLAYDSANCTRCRNCKNICEKDVHIFAGDSHYVNWKNCVKCLKCIDACDNHALYQNSVEISEKELLYEIEQDRRFYERSSGGVTLSGGEPVLLKEDLKKILTECKGTGIHTAVETAGNYPFDQLEPLLESIDLVIIDCKAYSEEIHKNCTGHTNKQILFNIQRLSDIQKKIWVRIPAIWNVNITFQEMEKIAVFLKGKRIEKVELLPYHKMGIQKYKLYGKAYSLNNASPPDPKQLEQCYNILKRYNIPIS